MPIHGTIEEAGLPDVLHLLTMGGKTGCLSVADGDAHGEIYLESGRIGFAEVTGRRSRSANVRVQIEEAVYQLLGWKQGEFTFTSNTRPPHSSAILSLDPEALLLEGARRVDEWGLIRRRIPSFDLVYRRSGSSLGLAAADLTPHQRQILPLLDGTRDVAALIESSSLGEFDAGKALYGLVTAGFASLLERRSKVRHLEYREVLAYVVREAAAVDPEWRKDAARHIADCPSCARRLRNIHVRRTEGSGDERRARDRRQLERRAVSERRVAVTAAWQQQQAERRAGSRRAAERRGTGTSRRVDDIAPITAVLTIGSPAPLRPASPGGRRTEARRVAADRQGQRRPRYNLSAPDGAKPADQTPPPKAPAPPPSREPSREIVWLTTPEETNELIRRDSQARMPPPPPAPPKPPPPIVVVEAPPPLPVINAPAPRARRQTPPGLPEPATVPWPRHQPGTSPRRTAHARRKAQQLKTAAIATIIAGVGLTGGYSVMELGSMVTSRMDASATAVPVRSRPEPAPAPTPSAQPEPQAAVADTPPAAPMARPSLEPAAPIPATIASPAPATAAAATRAPAPGSAPAPAPVALPVVNTTPALAPDSELADGGWTAVDRAEAALILGGTLAAIQGLRIESIATSSVGGRPRVRVAQIARSGERIVLTQMGSGAGSPARGMPRPTEVSAEDMSEGAPLSIGTASLGGVFITARSAMPAAALRPLLLRLAPAR